MGNNLKNKNKMRRTTEFNWILANLGHFLRILATTVPNKQTINKNPSLSCKFRKTKLLRNTLHFTTACVRVFVLYCCIGLSCWVAWPIFPLHTQHLIWISEPHDCVVIIPRPLCVPSALYYQSEHSACVAASPARSDDAPFFNGFNSLLVVQQSN